MNLYLSGPMTGIPEFNFPLFDEIRDSLIAQGHTVASPADHDREVLMAAHGVTPEEVDGYAEGNIWQYSESAGAAGDLYVWDFDKIMTWADGIVLMPGWENSTGARYERIVAESRPICVYTVHQCTVDPSFWALASDIQQNRLTALLKEAVESHSTPCAEVA